MTMALIQRLPFLQERLPVDRVLAHCRRLPGEIGTGRITLEQIGTIAVPATDQQRHTERTHATRLRVLLHQGGYSLDELGDRDQLAIGQEIVLSHFAGLLDQQPIVGSHARVDHANVFGDHLHTVHGLFVVQDGLVLVLSGEDNTICR